MVFVLSSIIIAILGFIAGCALCVFIEIKAEKAAIKKGFIVLLNRVFFLTELESRNKK